MSNYNSSMQPKVIVFDIETLNADNYVSPATPMSIAVSYNPVTDVQTVYTGESGKRALARDLDSAVKAGYQLVGHNIRNFDANVIDVTHLSSAMVDTMARVQSSHYGKDKATLETLATCTLGRGKVKAGSAIDLGKRAMSGDMKSMKKLVAYCTMDVMLTYELYCFGLQHGYVQSLGGEAIKVDFK